MPTNTININSLNFAATNKQANTPNDKNIEYLSLYSLDLTTLYNKYRIPNNIIKVTAITFLVTLKP